MTQASVKIRDMGAEDLLAVVKIISSHDKIDGRLAEQYYHEYFENEERIASAREMNCIAETNSMVTGVSGFSPDKYDWPDILWLNWFYVHPEYRRQGIGSALMRFTLDRIRKFDIRKVYLDTDSDPFYAPAISLYEHFGFKKEGLLVDYYGRGEHLVIMGLKL
jgi:ribosomal protein S18 acetylase RimI-like enzyme